MTRHKISAEGGVAKLDVFHVFLASHSSAHCLNPGVIISPPPVSFQKTNCKRTNVPLTIHKRYTKTLLVPGLVNPRDLLFL